MARYRRDVCGVLNNMIQEEVTAGTNYRDLRGAVKASCPKGLGKLCEKLVDNIIQDEKKHNETLKILRDVICRGK
jgi:hypothetical protein